MLRLASANLALQAITVLSKAVLFLVIARYLPLSEVGVFGLVVLTLGLALHLAGLDFYAYSTREILARGEESAARLFRDQLLFHLASYTLIVPALLLLFQQGVLEWRFLWYFLALLVLEQLVQELQRLLFTLSRPVRAAWLFFLRGGAWGWAAIALLIARPEARRLEVVFQCWLAGLTIALIYALYCVRDLDWRGAVGAEIDWGWIRRGMAVGLPLLIASLAFRAMTAVDRYVLERHLGTEAVGVYTFYANIRNVVLGALEFGVILILRPRIVAAFQDSSMAEYRQLMRKMGWFTATLGAALCLGAALLIRPLLALLEDPAYGKHLGAFALILVSAAAVAMTEIPHTGLYARHLDGAIIVASLAGLVVAITANLFLVPRMGIEGAALATLMAVLVLGASKTVFLMRAR